jgi:hypothetical protein
LYLRYFDASYKSGTEYRLLGTSCFILVLFVFLISFFTVFNDIYKNISVISWRSVLLVEETGVPGKKPSTYRTSMTNCLWTMGTALNHIEYRFQNYCYESTIQFLATNVFVLHAFLQNVNYLFCARMIRWKTVIS